MQLPGMMVRAAFKAELADWSELMRSGELNPWMMAKLEESYHQARQDDQRQSIVQKVMQKCTDFFRQGDVTLSYVCFYCHCFPREDCICCGTVGHVIVPRAGRNSVIGGAWLAATRTTRETRT